jgi:hypothetical protein
MTIVGDASADVTAWATVAAVVVALAGSVGVGFWRWINRPELWIEFGNIAPLYTLEPTTMAPEWNVIRARITNKGQAGASGARAQITGVWFKAESRPRSDGREWVRLTQMPIPLEWASRSHEASGAREKVDLAQGAIDFVEVSKKYMLETDFMGYNHVLCGLGNVPQREDLKSAMEALGEFQIAISVFSDTAKPTTKVVSYRQGQMRMQLEDLHEVDKPPKDAEPK